MFCRSQLAHSLHKKANNSSSSTTGAFPQLTSFTKPTATNGVDSPTSSHIDPSVSAKLDSQRKLSLKSGNMWDSLNAPSELTSKNPTVSSTTSSANPAIVSNGGSPFYKNPVVANNPSSTFDMSTNLFNSKNANTSFTNAFSNEGISPGFLRDCFPSSNSITTGTASPKLGSPFNHINRPVLDRSPSSFSQSRSAVSGNMNPGVGTLQQPQRAGSDTFPDLNTSSSNQPGGEPNVASANTHSLEILSSSAYHPSGSSNGISAGLTQSVASPVGQVDNLADFSQSPLRRGPSRFPTNSNVPVGNSMSIRDTDSPLNILVDKAKAKASIKENASQPVAPSASQREHSAVNSPAAAMSPSTAMFSSEAFPQHLASLIPPALLHWLYKDPQNNVQGPFTGVDMHQWYRAGYFPLGLPIKRLEEEEYYSLAFFIRQVGNQLEPFLVPLSPVTVQNASWNAQGTDLPLSNYLPESSEQNRGGNKHLELYPSTAEVSNVRNDESKANSLSEISYNQQSECRSSELNVNEDSANQKEESALGTSDNSDMYEKENTPIHHNESLNQLSKDLGSISLSEETKQEKPSKLKETVESKRLSTGVQKQSPAASKEIPVTSGSQTTAPKPSPWKSLPPKHLPSLDETISREMSIASSEALPQVEKSNSDQPPVAIPSTSKTGSPWAKVSDVSTSMAQEIQRMEKQNENLKSKVASNPVSQTSTNAKASTPALASGSIWGSPSVINAWANKPAALKSPLIKKNIQQAELAQNKQQSSVTTASPRSNALNANTPKAAAPSSNVTMKNVTSILETSTFEGEDTWSVVGPGGKIVNQQSPSAQQTTRSPSKVSATLNAGNSQASTSSKLQQVVSMSGHSPDFLAWCKISLKGLNEGVNYEEFLDMLLSLPAENNVETFEIISDSIYANSTIMDGRRFASEFTRRRIADLTGKDGQQSNNKSQSELGNSSGAWSQVVRNKPKQGTEWNSAFKVVTSKKKQKAGII